jgi:uncharacterized membrane protein
MRFSTETDRVEAFTDRVLAVILVIMVFELRAPQGTEPRSLLPTLPAIATFALSFILIGIYWNNYHHMLRASRGVDGRARWANLHLLFWLSLVPFATTWLGQNPMAVVPTVVYTLILLINLPPNLKAPSRGALCLKVNRCGHRLCQCHRSRDHEHERSGRTERCQPC